MSVLLTCHRLFRQAALGVALALLCPLPASAVIPVSKSDDELATEPIVVVARWNKAPLKAHELIEGNICRHSETHTELVVERVLRGEVKAGKHKLLLQYPIGWEEKGGQIVAYSSTMMLGDIAEVGDANLWFLSRERSWDTKDKHAYLCLETYRNVQPLALEAYFQALMSDDPPAKMAAVFRSREPIVVRRCLEYAAGGGASWPLTMPKGFEFLAPQVVHPPVTALAAEAEKLLDEPKAPQRSLAAAVYAKLTGAKSLPRLRKLLEEKDSQVRATAIALLARQRDAESSAVMCRAADGIEDALLGCAIVEAIGEWKDERVVPVLIALLQNDNMAYQSGDDWGIPAVKAQAALTKIVGYTFPFDVKAGLKAWDEAKKIRDPKARQAYLTEALPFDPQPLKASYAHDGKQLAITVTNASPKPVTLSKMPADVEVRWSSGVSGHGFDEPDGAASFVSLEPGKSMHFKVDFDDDSADPAPTRSTRFKVGSDDDSAATKVALSYMRNGNKFGVNAWIGTVEAKPAKSDAKGKGVPKP